MDVHPASIFQENFASPCLAASFSAAAELIRRSSRYEHITALLWSAECISFKLAVHVYQCLHGLVLLNLSDYITTSNASPIPTAAISVVILTASDPTYTAVHCWRSCVIAGWKPPLEQSAARHHLSSNADCFSEPSQNVSLFPIISFLTVFGFSFCTPCMVVA